MRQEEATEKQWPFASLQPIRIKYYMLEMYDDDIESEKKRKRKRVRRKKENRKWFGSSLRFVFFCPSLLSPSSSSLSVISLKDSRSKLGVDEARSHSTNHRKRQPMEEEKKTRKKNKGNNVVPSTLGNENTSVVWRLCVCEADKQTHKADGQTDCTNRLHKQTDGPTQTQTHA